MTLTFHPAADRPKLAAFLAFALGILLKSLWHWLSPVSALVIWLALVVSLRDFFLPSTYELSQDALTVKRLTGRKSYPWARFRSYISDRNGLFLSPYKKRRSTENQRGVFLPLSPDGRRQAAKFCRDLGLEKRAK